MTPGTKAYLTELPDGLSSYPAYRVKMAVVRTWIEGCDRDRLVRALPAELEPELLLSTPVAAWIGEVAATTVYLTVRDEFFSSDDQYVLAAYAKNARLLRSPLYRVLGRLLSPERIQKAGAAVFARLHDGIETSVERDGDSFRWTLAYPPHLVPALIARCYATALRAALELGGWRDVGIELLVHTATLAEFRARQVTA